MANVIHNEDVKNEQDLQNLVTSVILQTDKNFTQDRIVKLVKKSLKGSKFYEDLSLIRKYVTDTLEVLQNNNVFRCCNGIYSKRIIP